MEIPVPPSPATRIFLFWKVILVCPKTNHIEQEGMSAPAQAAFRRHRELFNNPVHVGYIRLRPVRSCLGLCLYTPR